MFFQGPHLEIQRSPLGPRRGALICHGLITLAVMVARYNLMTNFYNEPGQTYKPGQTYNKPGQTVARANLFLVQNLNQKRLKSCDQYKWPCISLPWINGTHEYLPLLSNFLNNTHSAAG